MRSTPFVVVLSAPSGAGKTTIAQHLVQRRRDVGFSVSATTRAPRPGEKDGKAYHFISSERFQELRRQGEFLECAQYAGEWYGTLKSEIRRVHDLGRHVLLDIEIEGARQVRQVYPQPRSISIFVLPPTPVALMQRLKRRKSESLQSLRNRLERAVDELREATSYDYVVINDRLPSAVAEVSKIIDAEELRTDRHVDLSQQLEKLSSFLVKQLHHLKAKTTPNSKVKAST